MGVLFGVANIADFPALPAIATSLGESLVNVSVA